MFESAQRLGWLAAGLLALSSCSTLRDTTCLTREGPRFLTVTNFFGFKKSDGPHANQVVLISPELKTPIQWDDLVISWNAVTPRGTGLQIEARAIYPGRATRYYTLGYWSEDPAGQRRESVTGQKDEDGDVKTDTLLLKLPADRLQLRVSLFGADERPVPRLKLLGLSLLNSKALLIAQSPNTAAWGKSLQVPERSQLSYQDGRDWCSPTAVSMVLGYWSVVLKKPELDADVPRVAAGVHDPNWPGTGNWPFNTAFAGSFEGIRGCVVRLADVAELETLLAARVPPIVSVSYDALYARLPDRGNGHLVVCAGFTKKGDVVINDPWADFSKGDTVRQVVPRENFVKAWRHSRQTAYLIHPENWPLPDSDRW
jgi:Peptidase_C39 like family